MSLCKRAFDLVLTFTAIIILLPFLTIISVLVAVRLGFPVIFRQERPGLCGRPFWLMKFRTMTDERDNQGVLLPDAKRLTAFGRFLRAVSLDELP